MNTPRNASRPPALARRLLAWAARRLGTPDLVDDAAEIFAGKAAREGPRIARAWYLRQARAALVAALRPMRRPGSSPAAQRPAWRGLSLDAKLAVRMLGRYPGLTVVAGLAMAFAISVGSATFEVAEQMARPQLPLPGGERLVGIRYWDRAANRPVLPLPAAMRTWAEALSTIQDVGAFRDGELNLAVAGEAGEPVALAFISPVGFEIAGVPARIGRVLVESDARPGAPPVAVLGHRLWQRRFGGDPAVVGRTVRLGDVRTTVVGVMPEGFGFPRDHTLWAPLRPDDGAASAAPPLRVFGRLAPDATLDEARAELATLAASSPDVRRLTAETGSEPIEHLVPEVVPYWESLFSMRVGLTWRAALFHLNVYPALFLMLVSANVALLMFARAATRERELVLRNALGASRGRIVMQLFVEALVLGGFAAALGLALTGPVLGRLYAELQEIAGPFPLPFWVRPQVSGTTVVYAGVLTIVGAAIAGVVPALKSTGRGMQARLHETSAGGGGPRFGGVWKGVVVTQIAATVVFAGGAWTVVNQAVRNASVEAFFPAEQYLGILLAMDGSAEGVDREVADTAFQARYLEHVRALERRLEENPAVAAATLVRRLPVKARGTATIEVDEGGSVRLAPERTGHMTYTDAVDVDFFETFGAPVLSGRVFDLRDLDAAVPPVVVNASFVTEVLGGRNAPGRRIRYATGDASQEPGPWHEIVGVVGDLVSDQVPTQGFETPPKSRVYHPLDVAASGAYPLYLVVHVPGDPHALAAGLYRTAASASPALRLHDVATLDRAEPEIALMWRLLAGVILLVSGIALGLSLAGIYAIMSFTVARRTREIGVRVALGAKSARVAAEVFRRPLSWIGAGVGIGCVLVALLVPNLTGAPPSARGALLLVALAVGALGTCMLACVVPTVRALRVEPSEALGTM